VELLILLKKIYSHHYCPGTGTAFIERPISSKYAIIYGDATYLSVHRGSVSKEALHILISITYEGEKEVLDYTLYPSESPDNYREMLLSLQ